MKSIYSLLAVVVMALSVAGCGKENDPSKLTCNDLGKITDHAVLDVMKDKCGLGGQPYQASSKKEW